MEIFKGIKKITVIIVLGCCIMPFLLIAEDLNINEKLIDACEKGKPTEVKKLLAAGADINYTTKDTEFTPLLTALMFSQYDIAVYLIEHGAAVDMTDHSGRSLLNYTNDQKTFKLLVKKGLKIDKKDRRGTYPIHWAAASRHLNAMKVLVDLGANINTLDSNKLTPLHWACIKPEKEMLEFLLANGAKINARDSSASIPLHYASMRDNPDCLALLISKGADINAIDKDGNTPLHYAGIINAKKNIEFLLKNGANKNIKNKEWKLYSQIN